ncbi:MAG: hypothetical protein HQK63_06695 [Desulfamplus sp.]|nr:hypothetical protein [Desulfamplus sp.]
MKHDVTIFRAYPFKLGHKIRIEGSGRNGDWEVIKLSPNKMVIECPISHAQISCDRFCFFVEEKSNEEWPKIDDSKQEEKIEIK